MIRLAQAGFVVGAAIFLALTVYYYPIPAMGAACVAICIMFGALNAGSESGLSSGAGCLGLIVIIFGAIYGLAWLFFGGIIS